MITGNRTSFHTENTEFSWGILITIRIIGGIVINTAAIIGSVIFNDTIFHSNSTLVIINTTAGVGRIISCDCTAVDCNCVGRFIIIIKTATMWIVMLRRNRCGIADDVSAVQKKCTGVINTGTITGDCIAGDCSVPEVERTVVCDTATRSTVYMCYLSGFLTIC